MILDPPLPLLAAPRAAGPCSGANPTSTECRAVVDPATAGRWLYYPVISFCCFCCTSASGCGVVKPDWVVAVNGTYLGRAAYKSPYQTVPAVDSWKAQGNSVRERAS